MKHQKLRYLILTGTVLLTCLMVVQVYWFRKAFDVTERQFDHTVLVALRRVADSVSDQSKITKLSSNFFFVTANSPVDVKAIDRLVRKEFLFRNLETDYELGVYDAYDDTLVHGNYVEATKRRWIDKEINRNQTSSGRIEKNFAVYFPRKPSYLAAELDIWIFSTFGLLMMVGFFAYAMHSLLREKRFAELKTDFINTMTHEFKTPVTNIRLAAEILQKKLGDSENSVYFDIIEKENKKLQSKIETVLLGSSLEYLRKPDFERLDVHELIHEVADLFKLKILDREGSLTLDFNATNSYMEGDKDLLSQAIANLIDNAEKYSLEKPEIRITTRNTSRGIEIDFVDRGIGIPPEARKKVFDKFFRVPSVHLHHVKGFGLGLNFVLNVIRSHRGRLLLVTEYAPGTDVKVILPVK